MKKLLRGGFVVTPRGSRRGVFLRSEHLSQLAARNGERFRRGLVLLHKKRIQYPVKHLFFLLSPLS